MDPRTAIDDVLRRHRVPGAVVAWERDGERTIHPFGVRGLHGEGPVDASTVFHLYSGTKLYTAAAVMLLIDAGELTLDTPVAEVLPELVLDHPVSIEQLLSHSSGLPDTVRAFLRVHLAHESAPSTREALERFELTPGKPPGNAAYRNANYALLGEVVSRVSGSSYADFVEAELLRPLGSTAGFAWTDDRLARRAQGTHPRWSPIRLAFRWMFPDVPVFGPARGRLVSLNAFELDTQAIGGLLGTATDFLPLLTEVLTPDDGVLGASSKRAMLTLHARGAAGVVSRTGVGLGFKRGDDFWNHEGGGPGYCSESRIYPDDRLAIVLLANRTQSTGLSRMAHAICESIRGVSRS